MSPSIAHCSSKRAMCRCLRIHQSSFCAWLKNPTSKRAREDARQTELVKNAWQDSGKVNGYPNQHDDLLDQGETCCPNCVARLTKLAGIKVQIGYEHRPGRNASKPPVVVDNTLDRQFDAAALDSVWVTDITYSRRWKDTPILCRTGFPSSLRSKQCSNQFPFCICQIATCQECHLKDSLESPIS